MLRKTFIAFTAVLMGSTALATTASAQDTAAKQPPLRATIMFAMLDDNGDGALDAAEIGKLTDVIIATLDTDGDGALSQDEVGAMRGMGFGPQRAGRGDRDGRDGRGWHQRGPRGAQMQAPWSGRGQMREERQARAAAFLGIDEDGVTQQEFLDKHAERFASLDANKDGTVTAEEFAAARLRFRGPPAAK